MWEGRECGVNAFRNKTEFEKNGHNELALTLKIDPREFILEKICAIKKYDCCNDNCRQCYNFRNIEDILIASEGVSEVKYARWVSREKRHQKDEAVNSGDYMIVMLKEILTKSFKMHIYNISRQ